MGKGDRDAMNASPTERRMLRVMDHIHANPAGDLSLDELAEVAAMSRFHFHRVFRALTGETCAQAVRRIRLHLAASQLMRSGGEVDAVARNVGYTDRDSFDRAFRAQYGMTPVRFRDLGQPLPLIQNHRGTIQMYPVDIRDLPERQLVGLPHTGAYYRISEAFSRVDTIVAARGLYPRLDGMFACFYDDVSSVPEAELNSFAAFALLPGTPVPEGLESRTQPAGPHAVLTFKGPYANLPSAYDYLFGQWLVGSGRDLADAPSFEHYLNTPMNTAPEDLMTEICLPLKPA
ncbi:AraC family transcriptional regulator [Pseudooceanicola pacificus]|nr:AraC family transcriptional regulator [Pseudooceanicola pacificus]